MVLEFEEEGPKGSSSSRKQSAESSKATESSGAGDEGGAKKEEEAPAPKPRRAKRPSMKERPSGAAGFWFGSQLSEHNVNIDYQNTFSKSHEEPKQKSKKRLKDPSQKNLARTRSRRTSSQTAFFRKFLGCAYRNSADLDDDGAAENDGEGDDSDDESHSGDEGVSAFQKAVNKRMSSFGGSRLKERADSDDADASGSSRSSVSRQSSRAVGKRMTPTSKSLSLAAIDASSLDDNVEAGHKFAHFKFGKNSDYQDFPSHPLNRTLPWFDYLVHTELCTINYDALLHSDAEKLNELMRMFLNLKVLQTLKLKTETLKNFVGDVWRLMKPNFYHNFSHVTDVTQCMYTLLVATRLAGQFDPRVAAAAITAALCHDLDHPGLSNVYQNSEKTELSVRYDGKSPLENHHCAMFDTLVAKHDLLGNVPGAEAEDFKRLVKRMILTTDMANHNQLMSAVREKLEKGEPLMDDFEGKALLLSLVLKCSDISNPARPWRTSERWTERVYQEFYNEGELDRAAGRAVSALHDQKTNNISKSSVGFITYIVEPLYKLLGAALQACAASNPAIHVRVVDECLVMLAKNKERHKQASEHETLTTYQTESEMITQDHNDRLVELQARPGVNGYFQFMSERRFNYRTCNDAHVGVVQDEDANLDRSGAVHNDLGQFFAGKGESTNFGEKLLRHHEPSDPAPEEVKEPEEVKAPEPRPEPVGTAPPPEPEPEVKEPEPQLVAPPEPEPVAPPEPKPEPEPEPEPEPVAAAPAAPEPVAAPVAPTQTAATPPKAAPATPTGADALPEPAPTPTPRKKATKRVSKAEAQLRRELKAAEAAAIARGETPKKRPSSVKKRPSTMKKKPLNGTIAEEPRDPEASPEEPSPSATAKPNGANGNGAVATR